MTSCKRGVACRLIEVLLGLALLAGVSGARAQSVRDSTLPPFAASSSAAAGQAAHAPPTVAPVVVIVRDGHPYLVVGTRLYAQGQMLGDARIERITETAVWLREGKTLRMRPVFAGIERRVAGTAAPAPPCVPGDKKKKSSTRAPPSEICPP